MNVEEKIAKIFPDYFERFAMPEGAREEMIQVYRACKTRECDAESFTPSFEEKGCKYGPNDREDDPSVYSLSTYENPKHIYRFLSLTNAQGQPYTVAVGKTNPIHGIVQRTKERIKGKKGSHVDWWLYKDAKPYIEFKMIEDFNEYLKNYEQK